MTPPREPAPGRAARPVRPAARETPAPPGHPHPGDNRPSLVPAAHRAQPPGPPGTGDHAAERAVFVRYLKAVINVYAPWTTSPVVNDRERRFAHARITKAQDLLNRLPDRHPSDGPRPPR